MVVRPFIRNCWGGFDVQNCELSLMRDDYIQKKVSNKMSILLLPVSLFIKRLNDLPISYLRELPIYIFILLILFSIILRKKVNVKGLFNSKVFIFVFIFFGLQLIAMLMSYIEIGNSVLNRNPIKEFTKLIIFAGCIFIHYYTVHFIVNSKQSIQHFIKGNFIALVILLSICYIQLLYLFMPNIFDGFTSFIGKYFEGRHDREWYTEGSYVQTMKRINGLSPEPGYLAAQLLIIFVPFILASIKNKVNIFSIRKKYNPVFFYFLLFSIIVILFSAKTTTGILAVFLIIIFFWLSLPRKRKILLTYFILIFGTVTIILIKNTPYLMGIINDYLLNKNDGSTMNRLGGTIGLVVTWLTNFIVGIGWNYKDYYLFQNVPAWSTNNWEYNNIFVTEHFYPILSIFFGWLAEFGTFPVIFLLIYTNKLLKDFRRIEKKAEIYSVDENNYKLICVLKDSVHFFVLYYMICSLLSFNWFESIYLIMFFFFIVVRQYYINEFNKYNF